MRRRGIAIALILMIVAGVAIGVTAYNYGYNRGLEHTGAAVQVVRYAPGFGLFPFFFVFPLLFFSVIALSRAGRHGHGHWAHRPWDRPYVEERLGEWHDGQHDRTPSHPSGSA